MVNWKKAVVIGSVAAGALLLTKRQHAAGAALATLGLVVLASEYPEQFEEFWDNAPDYISRGAQIFSTIQHLGERFSEEVQSRGLGGALRTVGSEHSR